AFGVLRNRVLGSARARKRCAGCARLESVGSDARRFARIQLDAVRIFGTILDRAGALCVRLVRNAQGFANGFGVTTWNWKRCHLSPHPARKYYINRSLNSRKHNESVCIFSLTSSRTAGITSVTLRGRPKLKGL